MAGKLIQHIESFVDSASSPSHQTASLDAIAYLVKNDLLSMEALVREMGMYLTTADDIIRARGVLLLAELLKSVASKPLDDTSIHSLIGFFTDKLADWKALHGGLVGCLAMMRRRSNAGMVTSADAKVMIQSYLVNVQVQALGRHDRKICFELQECVLTRYADAALSLGDTLIYGICEAIDGEKDPECLMLTFHVVELLAQIFLDSDGPLGRYAADFVENLERYFPIHYTHPKGEDDSVKREELSRALMLAFSSTPLFEPFVIPLLLEKLSSSLPVAKVDSLKYLNNCMLKYGSERMEKYAGAIWLSLKDVMFTSQQEPDFLFASDPLADESFDQVEVEMEALELLKKVIMQKNGLTFIVGDEDINMVFNSMTSYRSYSDITPQNKRKLCAVGRILHVSAKSSISSCNVIFDSFFFRLMDSLGIPPKLSLQDHSPKKNSQNSEKINFGALYLCIELLAACRDLVVGSLELASNRVSGNDTFCSIVQKFSPLLTKAFSNTMSISTYENSNNRDICLGVHGLQILATFPLVVSTSIFENILLSFLSILTTSFDKTLWRMVLKAAVNIGSFIDKYNETERALIYMRVIVDKMVSLLFLCDSTMPSLSKVEAIFDIGSSGQNYMLKIVHGLQEAILANFSNLSVHGNLKSTENNIWLLEFYSLKVLPWIQKTEGFEEIIEQFVVSIWGKVESCMVFNTGLQEKGLLEATMTAVKLAAGSCSVENQDKIIQKAYSVLSSSTFIEFNSKTIPIQVEELKLTRGTDHFSYRDEWIISLFASVIIALRPQTRVPNIKEILRLFMITLLKGHIPSAHALGSVVNKLPLKSNGHGISCDCTLEEAMEIIFKMRAWTSQDVSHLRECGKISNDNEMGLLCLCVGDVDSILVQNQALVGLAWVGKGLLQRGHEKVKDITMVFLDCLLRNARVGAFSQMQDSLEVSHEQHKHLNVKKCAADAFHILMSDSEVCLNKKFHAMVRPLYKQHFFSTTMPILQSLIMKADSSSSRAMLYRASVHIIADTPLIVILSESKKLLPIMMEGLSILFEDRLDKEIIYCLLLVLSGILTEENGKEAVIENVNNIIKGLSKLVSYPHMMLVRKTAIRCVGALSRLPHIKIYPTRTQVLHAISNALDDPKRSVRQEAVKCRQAWAAIA